MGGGCRGNHSLACCKVENYCCWGLDFVVWLQSDQIFGHRYIQQSGEEHKIHNDIIVEADFYFTNISIPITLDWDLVMSLTWAEDIWRAFNMQQSTHAEDNRPGRTQTTCAIQLLSLPCAQQPPPIIQLRPVMHPHHLLLKRQGEL